MAAETETGSVQAPEALAEPDRAGLAPLAAQSARWVVLEKWGNRTSSLVVLLLLGRLLTPAAFGLVALASVYITLLTVFVDQGFGRALVQRHSLDAQHPDTAFWTAVASAVVMFGGSLVLAPWVADLFNEPKLTNVIRWLSVAFLLNALSGTPQALLERNFEFQKLAIRRLTGVVVGDAAAIIVALNGGGVWSLVAQTLVTGLVSLITLWASTSWRPGVQVSQRAFHELWTFGIGSLGIEVVGFINSQSDRIVIGAFFNATELGYYFLAVRIITLVIELFSAVFATLALPILSRLQGQRDELATWFYRLVGFSSAISVPAFALTAVCAPVLLPLVVGGQWKGSVDLLQILSLMGASVAVAYLDRSALLSVGRTGVAFWLTVGQTVVGLLLLVLGAQGSVTTVAVALVVRGYVYWPVRLWILKRVMGLSPWQYARRWLGPALATSGMMALVVGDQHYGWSERHPYPYVFVAGIAGLVFYFASLRVLSPSSFNELRAGLKRVAHRGG